MFMDSLFDLHRDELFTPRAGARENANRVLVVITDGASNDRNDLGNAAWSAQQKKIVRYAIGVSNSPAMSVNRTFMKVYVYK